jgi:hypothetical protein
VTITEVITAIDSDLESIPINDATGTLYGIAAQAGITEAAFDFPPWSDDWSVTNLRWEEAVINDPNINFWANITPEAVATPPGPAPLALAGLGAIAVLMWKQRQDALRHAQAN